MIFSGLRKNSPYTSQINQAILKLQENGVRSLSSISADHHFYVYYHDRGHDYDIGKLTMKYDVGHYTKGDPNSGVDDVQAEKRGSMNCTTLFILLTLTMTMTKTAKNLLR